MENVKEKALGYALKNAIAHEGKANQGAIISGLFAEGLKKEEVKNVAKDVAEVLKKVNSMSIEKQQEEFEKLKGELSERETRVGLPELPNAEKGIVMRFAPAPSGPLHLGHVIGTLISSLFVKKYGGKFYVRIEDTNPEKIDKDAYKGIVDICDWLFGNVTEYIIQSERMPLYYKYAEKLIDSNHAYVCTCSQDEFKKYAESKTDCPCRNLNVKETKERWKKMLDKNGFKEGEAVLRFKSSMADPNPAMRDFPLARINEHEHPKQGHKYKVWPLMNLAVPVDDLELGMTHIVRGKDHMDNAKRQAMLYRALGKEDKIPWTFFMGRIKFTDMDLSKRKIKAAIDAGEFEGWDDARLPTLASLRKRGYKPETFWKFAEHRGLSDVDKVMDSKDLFKILDNFNEEKSQ